MNKLLIPVCLAFTLQNAAAEEILPAYNTYSAVPFVVSESGLATELVDYLNSKLKGKYQFKLRQMTRDALNKEVINDPAFKGVVMFLSPYFVNDAAQSKFWWSQAIWADGNTLISHNNRKLEYNGPETLYNLKFGGITGNRYAGLEEHFGKEITREDMTEELNNLKKLGAGRIDATIMPRSTYRYLLVQMGKEMAAKMQFHTSSKPHAEFTRHFFIAKNNQALAKELDSVVNAMKTDPQWKALAAKYHLD